MGASAFHPLALSFVYMLMTYSVNANAIPVVIQMMLGILLDDDIKSRIMSEIEPMSHDNSL